MKSLRHFRIHFNQLFVKLLVILCHRSIQLDLHPLRTRHILAQRVIIVLADPRVVHQNFPKDGLYVIVGATDDDRELPPREKIVDLNRPNKKRNVRGKLEACVQLQRGDQWRINDSIMVLLTDSSASFDCRLFLRSTFYNPFRSSFFF